MSVRSPASLHRARLTPREALLFEAGVKLGGLFHQYLGIPVTPQTAPGLSRIIERAVALQPFVTQARVTIRPEAGRRPGQGPFAYRYLTGEMLDATITLAHGGIRVSARLRHERSLRYPLMRVERVSEKKQAH